VKIKLLFLHLWKRAAYLPSNHQWVESPVPWTVGKRNPYEARIVFVLSSTQHLPSQLADPKSCTFQNHIFKKGQQVVTPTEHKASQPKNFWEKVPLPFFFLLILDWSGSG
jgi:hypothetical protein